MLSSEIAKLAARVRRSADGYSWTRENIEGLAGVLAAIAADVAALEVERNRTPLELEHASSMADVCRRITTTDEHVTQDQCRTLAAYILATEVQGVAA